MATRALIGYMENGVLTSTYNHYDGYPENLGKALNTFYNTPEKAKEIANRGYISYVDPETGEIEAKNQDTPDKLDLNKLDPEQAVLEVADLVDSSGADYAYFYSADAGMWYNIKNYGKRQMSDALEGILFQGSEKMDENQLSPLHTDQGEISDNIYDYADRMMGAGVDDIEDLIMYYKNNPDEIPEPMDAKFFVQYADEIAQAVKDKERYEAGDVDAPDYELDEALVHQWKFRAGIIK